MPTVTIQIENDEVVPQRIAGVVVEVYNLAAVFQTSGTTDANGEVVFSLPIAQYDLVFFKTGVSILPKQPQRIDVLVAPPNSNTFLVSAHERVLQESIDPLKCRVTGRVVAPNGSPTVGRLIFVPCYEVIVADGGVMIPAQRLEYGSTQAGEFDFELYRGVKYEAYFLYVDVLFEEIPPKMIVWVPDSPAIELHKLLFPVPVDVTFTAATISLVAGGDRDETIEYDVVFEDGSDRDSVLWAYVKLTNTDEAVVDASISGGVLTLIPKAAGTATISMERVVSDRILFNPLAAFTTDSVVVTVT